MTPVQIVCRLMEANYDYSTVQLNVPPEIGDRILDWGKLNIPEDALKVDDDGGKGREVEQHITVLWGITSAEVPRELYSIAHTTAPFPVLVGRVSLFRNPEFDVVKCDIESPSLHRLNARISGSVPNEQTHPSYKPHATVAYVKKGTCDRLEGMDIFQDGSNEFIAYGMIFKGPGDGEDPTRVRETLLFSKVKQHQRAALATMTESVVGPTRAEMRQVREIIKHAQEQCHGDAALFVELANDGLANYGVKFEERPELVATHSPAMADDTGIYIMPPKNVTDPHLPDQCHMWIYHELVHGWQMNRVKNPAEISARATKYVMPNGTTINHDRYLQQKQEVMAHAASMVDWWERNGTDAETMRHWLKTGNWNLAQKYWYARQKYPQIFNRFVKYANQYIEQFEREKLGESEEPDPERYIDELAPAYVVRHVATGNLMNISGGFGRGQPCHFSNKVDAERAKFRIPWLHQPEEFEVVPVFPDVSENAPDPRNGPEKAHFKHAEQPDPFKDMPFAADQSQMSQFLRGRRKKRAARPVL